MTQGQASKVVSQRKLRIGMVAGEASGDILGAGLIESLKQRYPNAVFEGIGGPLMIRQGLHSMFPMERLSVMGLVEVLGRVFELIGIRRTLREHFVLSPPDVFIGIDAPDFNLGLEAALHKAGIKTTHYVSPSVWAWRQKRVFKIAKAVDLMLTLLPFEAAFYKAHKIKVAFVGHPLADAIPLDPQTAQARVKLELDPGGTFVAILPGSRSGEVKYIGPSFIEAARNIYNKKPETRFIIPCVNAQRRSQIEHLLQSASESLPIKLIDGNSRDVMAASNAVILASGTAALEAMLLKKPMVVAYKVSWLTHAIMKRLLKVAYVSLPNLLANKGLVPELIQDAAEPEAIADNLLKSLEPDLADNLEREFRALHNTLKRDASDVAADAVSSLIEGTV